jgi:hypothetical protein
VRGARRGAERRSRQQEGEESPRHGAAGRSGPPAERSGPAAEKRGPVADRSGPAVERSGPAAERIDPARVGATQVVQRTEAE